MFKGMEYEMKLCTVYNKLEVGFYHVLTTPHGFRPNKTGDARV